MKRNVPSGFSPLSEKLQHRLDAYALMAAAGIGIVGLATPTQAEIVYTPAHATVHPSQFSVGLPLDLNHDGATDFELINFIRGTYGRELVAPAVRGNQVVGSGSYASALVAGVAVGPEGPFAHCPDGTLMGRWNDSSGVIYSDGPWKDTRNRFLGFKFLIDGEYHFGWARLTVDTDHMLLTGYAYETVANKSITTGQESGSEDAARVAPTKSPVSPTLAHLAFGSNGLIGWRKKQDN